MANGYLDALRDALGNLELPNAEAGSLIEHRINVHAAHKLLLYLRAVIGQQSLFMTRRQRGDAAEDIVREEGASSAYWTDVFGLLTKALATHAAILLYQQYMPVDGGRRQHLCIADTCIVVAVRCLLCRLLVCDEPARHAMFAMSAATVPYCIEHHLCMTPTPVLSYAMDELNDALLGVSLQWPMLAYHTDLAAHVQLLAIRVGMLMSFRQTALTHNVEAYRSVAADPAAAAGASPPPVPADTRYITSPLATRYHRAALGSMLADLAVYSMFRRSTDGAPDLVARETTQRWLDGAPARLGLRESSRFIREHFIEFSLQPGHTQAYRMENNNMQAPKRSVLVYFMGTSVQEQLALSGKSPIKLAAELAARGHTDERRHLMAQLLWVECIQIALYQRCAKTVASDVFVHTHDELLARYDMLMASELPYIVRVFHHYQVLHRGTLYITDSVVGAFAAWLHIVRDQPRFAGLYREVFGQSSADPPSRRRIVDADPAVARHLSELNM